MTLDQWRIKKRLSYRKLAKLLGTRHATIARRWCMPPDSEERAIPSAKYMDLIVQLTNGAVTPNDFYLQRN